MINVKGTLAVLTGGGDCPGLNAVLNAVVKAALGHGYQIYGIVRREPQPSGTYIHKAFQ